MVDKILRIKDKSCVRRKYADAEYTDAGCTRMLRAPLSLEQMGVNYIRHAKLYYIAYLTDSDSIY